LAASIPGLSVEKVGHETWQRKAAMSSCFEERSRQQQAITVSINLESRSWTDYNVKEEIINSALLRKKCTGGILVIYSSLKLTTLSVSLHSSPHHTMS
jgi:hypothetical protein